MGSHVEPRPRDRRILLFERVLLYDDVAVRPGFERVRVRRGAAVEGLRRRRRLRIYMEMYIYGAMGVPGTELFTEFSSTELGAYRGRVWGA